MPAETEADPFLAIAGAVADTRLGVPRHYGSPLIEQRALAAGNAVVALSHRGIVTVSGEDRLTWLNSMTSQQLGTLAPGVSCESLLLDPRGRIEHVLRVVDDGERCWLLVDEGAAPALCEYLQRMRFAMRVSVADRSAEYAVVFACAGGRALPALAASGRSCVQWEDPWATLAAGGVQYARGEHAARNWSAVHTVFPRADLAAVLADVTAAGVTAAGLDALDALEIRAWRPTQHAELDSYAIPHEFDWLRTAVHLNKGCYRGQETVAKVHNLGHPPRRLALLHLDGSEGVLPSAGSRVYVAGALERPVGRITRAALHYEWGGIALALLKRSVPEDAALSVALSKGEAAAGGASPDGGAAIDTDSAVQWIAAQQEVIVPSDAGKTRDIPRLKRL